MKKTIWMIAILLVIGLSAPVASSASDGASVYGAKCAACHGANGAGGMMAPKLAGSDLIKGDADAIKGVIANGVTGGDKKYPNFPMAMPKFAFSDAELDSMVSYLKSL